MASDADNSQFNSYKLSWGAIAGIALFSVLYFADIFLKASRKCLWFDELFTTYLCRLPSFKATWTAVLHGADFNPPMLYLLTRGVQRVFGEGLVATRLPAMVGFWVFSVCLFLFVSRRAGTVAGFISGMFPFFTLAQYYAYEARAHAIVLGWCGLTLVSWQRAGEEQERSKHLWLAGFGVCLAGALLTHVYAVYLIFPFAVVELYNFFRRRPDWGIIATMGSAFIVVVVLFYLPLFRMYRATVPSTFRSASHDLLQRFLENTFGPAMLILLLSMFLFALDAMRLAGPATWPGRIPKRDMVAAGGLACVPLVALIGSKMSQGPFIERYFLLSVAGYAIALGFASSSKCVGSWTAKTLAGCMLVLISADLASTAYLAVNQRIMLREPSSGLTLSTTPQDPMRLYGTLSTDDSNLDILVTSNLEYLYLFKYAPPAVASHLYFGAAPGDLFFAAYKRLAQAARIDLKLTGFSRFLATHDRFSLYESGNPQVELMQAIADGGFRIKSARADSAGTMYEYAK